MRKLRHSEVTKHTHSSKWRWNANPVCSQSSFHQPGHSIFTPLPPTHISNWVTSLCLRCHYPMICTCISTQMFKRHPKLYMSKKTPLICSAPSNKTYPMPSTALNSFNALPPLMLRANNEISITILISHMRKLK